jgi:hypothetical protein
MNNHTAAKINLIADTLAALRDDVTDYELAAMIDAMTACANAARFRLAALRTKKEGGR